MNPLQLRLASLRRALYMVTVWRGMCALFAITIGASLLMGLADYYANLPAILRAAGLVAILGSLGYVFVRYLCMPLAARYDDLTLALRVEEIYPDLNDCLASTIQFLEEETPRSSPAMRKQAIEQAMKKADDCDFNRILDRRGVGLLGLAAVVIGVLGWWVYSINPFLSNTALVRLADPFGGHTWTQLTIGEFRSRHALGQPFILSGKVEGIIPANARLEIDGRTDKVLALKKDAQNQVALVTIPFDMTQYKSETKFKFRVIANDAVFPGPGAWQEVQVMPPPHFVPLEGWPSPQLELRFPDYTDLPSRKLSPGQGNVEDIVAGTQVAFRAAVDRPLADAWIELPGIKTVNVLGALTHPQPLEMLTLSWFAHTQNGRLPCQLHEGGKVLSVNFTAVLPGQYWLRFQDEDGLARDYRNDLGVFRDPPPNIHLQRPATSQSLLPDAQVTFKMLVEDERFAVRSVYVEYRRKNAEGKWLNDSPTQLSIVDHDMLCKEIPRLLTALAPGNLPSNVTLRLRPRLLDVNTLWPLRNRFKEGDIVVLQVCADDFNNLFDPRPVGRSHEIELRIVGKSELAKQLDEDFARIQQELVRLQHLQDDALKNVQEVEKNREEGKANHDKLVEAEQIQRQIQERVGQRKDEGLRQDLANLQQKLKDNKLPPSDMQDRMRTIAAELDRLVREDLQQIEAKLSEARKDMTKPSPKSKDSKDPKEPKSDALQEARAHQEDAKKTLDKLAEFLDPWANMHQIKGRTRDLLAKQKELKKETDALARQKGEMDPREFQNEQIKKEFQNELDKKADAQKNLAQEAQALMDMMEKVQERQKGSDTGQKVAEASKEAKKAALPEKMREAEEKLRDPNAINEAKQKQQDNIKNIEKVLDALEKDRRDEELDLLKKKQKEAEKNVDELARKQDLLQKKTREAAKIEDPKQRADELKKLAKEQEKLQEEAKEQARELARLRAEKASREMAKAAQEMERAVRKLEAGEDPEEMQEDALQRIENAEAKLEEAEEELAREQLARIADRIKGLKERQDAAVVESERIHKELERQVRWSRGLLGSLKDSAKTQQGLTTEAESLKEKLKDAKVFEHILDRAGQSMTRAAEAIKERAEDKTFDPLEKEELAAEKKAHDNIVKQQKLAAQRLDRLVTALKNDPALAQKQENPEGGDEKPMGGEEEQPGMKLGGGDGIPPIAQLKALREEQADVKVRTKEFDERHPDRNMLNNDQQAELRELEDDQSRLRDIFSGLVRKTEKGENP